MANVVLLQPTPAKPPVKYYTGLYPPLALLTVAAPLVEDGYSVKIVDQRLNPDWKRELLASVDDDTACVGISTLTGTQILYSLEASRLVKEHTDVPIVWGGVHPSLLPEQTVRHRWVDFVVEGEGDHVLLTLVRRLLEGREDFTIPGLWLKRNGSISTTPPDPFLDLNTLPRIPFDIVDAATYGLADTICMVTSRGCAHRCGFCYNVRHCGRRWRAMRPEKVLDDLGYYVETYRPRIVSFRDDNFFQDLRRVREICKGMSAAGLNVRWDSTCRVDDVGRMTDEDIHLLLSSGLDGFRFGIESGSQRVLDLMRKDLTLDEVQEVMDRLRVLGPLCIGTFMGGYPGETLEDLSETLRLTTRLFRAYPSFGFWFYLYRPYPGTPANEELLANGFRLPDSLEGWADINVPFEPVFYSARKKRSFYEQDTPWLSPAHKTRLLEADHLGQVAGRPLFRTKSILLRLLAMPYNLPIRLARWRWAHQLWGPVPERHVYMAVRRVASYLPRRLRVRLQAVAGGSR